MQIIDFLLKSDQINRPFLIIFCDLIKLITISACNCYIFTYTDKVRKVKIRKNTFAIDNSILFIFDVLSLIFSKINLEPVHEVFLN